MKEYIEKNSLINFLENISRTKTPITNGFKFISIDEAIRIISKRQTVNIIPIDKLKKLVDKLQDEKDYAYANFDEYKLDVLGCDDVDDLPNDDYRFGLNRAIELLQLLIAESEGNNEV